MTRHVVHVITGLETGGAETMLARLLTVSDPELYRHSVISLTTDGPLAGPLRDSGVPVHAMNFARGRVPGPTGLRRLSSLLRLLAPDVIQTWLYQADLAAGVASKLARMRTPVVWGIHHTTLDSSRDKRLTIIVARLCARLSSVLPARIICCGESALEVHAQLGYNRQRLTVVDNGIDVEVFRPDISCRSALRQRLGLSDTDVLVGRVARLHPQKDTPTLLKAMSMLMAKAPNVHLALVGPGFEPESPAALALLAPHANLLDRVHLLGPRRDVETLYPGFDVYASSSVMEAYPLSVAEALATSLPVVCTDTGDCVRMVGDAGRVVPMARPDLFSAALAEVVELSNHQRRALGCRGRNRAIQLMSLRSCAAGYQRVWDSVADGASAVGDAA